jgi:hypothetical protein
MDIGILRFPGSGGVHERELLLVTVAQCFASPWLRLPRPARALGLLSLVDVPDSLDVGGPDRLDHWSDRTASEQVFSWGLTTLGVVLPGAGEWFPVPAPATPKIEVVL